MSPADLRNHISYDVAMKDVAMKRVAWILGLVLILVGVGFRVFKRQPPVADSPHAADVAASSGPSALVPSPCPPYTLDDNGVCIPVPR